MDNEVSTNASMYDKSYYECTAIKSKYEHYSDMSVITPIYRSIAHAIAEIFRPKRILELGCGNGITLKYLQELGIEAYGVEISDYIIQKKLISRIHKASLHQLPFADNTFDVVFSCRVLEHIPDKIFNPSLIEISRVCQGYQFHMLPILGCYPYIGNKQSVLRVMNEDTTHHQIHDYDWWIEKFTAVNWLDTSQLIQYYFDSHHLELSNCQFLLSPNGLLPRMVLKRLKSYNLKQLIFYHEQLFGKCSNTHLYIRGKHRLYHNATYGINWKQIASSMVLTLLVENGHEIDICLELQFIDRKKHKYVIEILIQPGINMFNYRVTDLAVMTKCVDITRCKQCLWKFNTALNKQLTFMFGFQQDGKFSNIVAKIGSC
jgi:SAM-dependent methyltransferase